MKALIIYHSKTGNTKSIAEIIAKQLETEAIPVNLLEKKGRGTQEEQEKEKELFAEALNKCKNYDIIVIGTPTSFQNAHSKIIRFVKAFECSKAALFCTYYNKIGTKLTDLKAILKERKIQLVATCAYDNLKSGQYKELNDEERKFYITKAEEFAKDCISFLSKQS